MAQFRVYENANKSTLKTYPYLLDIQSDLLQDLRTTVVVPLCSHALAGKAVITKLCPTFQIEGQPFVALTPQLAGVDKKALGPMVCDLGQHRSELIAALDFLTSGV